MNHLVNDIEVIKSKTTKIHDVDFDNLAFGKVYTDHMLECNFKNEKWEVKNAPGLVRKGFELGVLHVDSPSF